ncbi:MAG: CAAX prenyl protease-related protein [Phycisphaerales bacterium]|nr:MAG: CAAX prenyl protease-related protein [Phycisphaerales bacterium]
MTADSPPARTDHAHEPLWLRKLARSRPHAPWLIPYLLYVGIFAFEDRIAPGFLPWLIAVRGVVCLYVVWLLRAYFRPWRPARLPAAVVVGVMAAVGWVAGQHAFNAIEIGGFNLGERLFLFPARPEVAPPHASVSAFSWRWQAALKLISVTVVVPLIEEPAWRGFLLRFMVDRHRFEEVPHGTFTWLSFVGTALISTLQHPDNWLVSIFCWMLYNALMYWKKSLTCVIIAHGVTNLLLYTYVLTWEDWMFW